MRRTLLPLALIVSIFTPPPAAGAVASFPVDHAAFVAAGSLPQPALAAHSPVSPVPAVVTDGAPTPLGAGRLPGTRPDAGLRRVSEPARLGFGFLLHHVRTGFLSVAAANAPPAG